MIKLWILQFMHKIMNTYIFDDPIWFGRSSEIEISKESYSLLFRNMEIHVTALCDNILLYSNEVLSFV